ncbi:MAG: PQQ-binding-like beta-propeller repeat protein [Acidobacteriota bacterium]|nr:PQQ-binding-like beta-propeller repeat protein [Acidobacteriota bacterium]
MTNPSRASRPLRLWPGVALAVFALFIRFGLPVALPDTTIFGMDSGLAGLLGSVIGTLGIIVWWLFFSRAPWSERLGALAVMGVAVFATKAIAHPSIAGAGQGYLIYLGGIQLMALALVLSAVASRSLSVGVRRASMAAALVAACGLWAIVRTDGVSSSLLGSDYHWRWTPTAEERLLAKTVAEPERVVPPPPVVETPTATAAPAPVVAEAVAAEKAPATGPVTSEGGVSPERDSARVEWAGFRGNARDGVVQGVRINTDWSASPPVQLWRRPIGPGWSSFAVQGDLIYTQEQRGDEEMVAAYRLSTGEPVWRHSNPVRFYESNGGAGPRATPTIDHDRVFAHGATGIVNALDARTGKALWSHDSSADTDVPVPGWGFSSSPLVIDGKVIIAASGALIAYDAATGETRWVMKSRGGSYSSPHLLTINGVPQVVLMGGRGTTAVAVADGTVLWENGWAGSPMVQPASLPGGDLLITSADAMGGLGVRRLGLTQGPGGWTVAERWTSRGLKPYFNDYVVHKGHAYGFDGNILSSVNLETGERAWKGGRYGNGQMLLLADQDVLLVTSEEGELALVSATPDKHTELARIQALNAKTWNHPVLIGDVLVIRNGEEMAAFRLALVKAATE